MGGCPRAPDANDEVPPSADEACEGAEPRLDGRPALDGRPTFPPLLPPPPFVRIVGTPASRMETRACLDLRSTPTSVSWREALLAVELAVSCRLTATGGGMRLPKWLPKWPPKAELRGRPSENVWASSATALPELPLRLEAFRLAGWWEPAAAAAVLAAEFEPAPRRDGRCAAASAGE